MNTMELPEKYSITLTKMQKIRLVPFFATVLIFFILYVPLTGYPVETFGHAFFKLLPTLSLAYYISANANDLPLGIPRVDDLIPSDHLSRHFLFAMLFSALGDISLVWRNTLFIPGLVFFLIAQVLYFIGLDMDISKSKTRGFFILLALITFLCVQSGIGSIFEKGPVAIYLAMLFSMAWRATARYETEGSKAALAGCVGALVFVASDFTIALDKWLISVPASSFIILTTYYVGQFGLTLSTTKELS